MVVARWGGVQSIENKIWKYKRATMPLQERELRYSLPFWPKRLSIYPVLFCSSSGGTSCVFHVMRADEQRLYMYWDPLLLLARVSGTCLSGPVPSSTANVV